MKKIHIPQKWGFIRNSFIHNDIRALMLEKDAVEGVLYGGYENRRDERVELRSKIMLIEKLVAICRQ